MIEGIETINDKRNNTSSVLDMIWQPTPAFLPEKSHGLRIMVGYSPRGRKESDTTE